MRIRIFYKKTGLITFVNHMDMPTLFSRAAKRAGLIPELTEGFSPHPRISMAAPLAIGACGLAEPADFWLKSWSCESLALWNKELPEGIEIVKAEVITDDFGLAKRYNSALYTVTGSDILMGEEAASLLRDELEKLGCLCNFSYKSGVITLTIRDLERYGASTFVKILKNREIIEGWQNLCILRIGLGVWNDTEKTFCPLLS